MAFNTIEEMIRQAEAQNLPIWQYILRAEAADQDTPEEEIFENMRRMYQAMRQADAAYDNDLRSASGLSGGDGERLKRYNQNGKNLAGPYLSLVMEKAVKMGESNACMKRIVAAPTAGACGVIPAVLLSYEELYAPEEDRLVEALFVCAGVGAVIARQASIAGASGGCQAEIGSASAMAAAGLACLQGGDGRIAAHAAALALKNMLGLTCDPVCGLVEVPCIKRNSAGAVNAVTSAQMALAGVESVIPVDQVIDAMRRIGNAMPEALKETGDGGLAATSRGKELKERLEGLE